MTSEELRTESLRVLEQARVAWDARREFRERRMRSRNYYRNKPKEYVTDPNTGRSVAEEDWIASQGRFPIRDNRIRPVVMSLRGQFRQNKSSRLCYGRNREDNDAADMMTEALRCVHDFNRTDDLDADAFEENLISGLYGWKTGFKFLRGDGISRMDVFIQNIDSTRMFYDLGLTDRRLINMAMIGEIHDMDLDQVIRQFAATKAGEERIRQIYSDMNDRLSYTFRSGFEIKDYMSFYTPVDVTKCRVIEVWRREYAWESFVHDPVTGSLEIAEMSPDEIAAENERRMIYSEMTGVDVGFLNTDSRYEGSWKVYYLAPDGTPLLVSRNPYWHESHPYTLGFGNFFDGEVWGIVEDIIDPQRLINRMTQALDYMWSASAKGVLLIDEAMIPDGMTITDFATEWVKFNGVIAYKGKPGMAPPTQVKANSVDAGIINWLGALQNNIKEVSGVLGAVQGLEPNSGTPASLYQQQIIQAQVTNRDYFDSFFAARRARDLKIVQLIAQFYDSERYLPIVGKTLLDGSRMLRYDPQRVREIDWDLIVTDTPDTPAARQQMEMFIDNLLATNRITFQQYLQASSHPKADMLMRLIQKTNPLLAEGKVSPEAVSVLQMNAQAGDPNSAALVSQAQ